MPSGATTWLEDSDLDFSKHTIYPLPKDLADYWDEDRYLDDWVKAVENGANRRRAKERQQRQSQKPQVKQ